ncbi:MAG: flavin-containing monooxygenase [Longimicrobiales bacterium]
MRVAVIGAGAAGLGTARHLLAEGIDVEVLERDERLGGVWSYGRPPGRVYRSTHMISSKPFTQFPDYPMPDSLPDYPHHADVLAYLDGYAEHFGLNEVIRYGEDVVDIRPEAGTSAGAGGTATTAEEAASANISSWSSAPTWRVRTADGTERVYDAVVIANGHNAEPRWPELPGRFDGVALHSAEYHTPEIFDGKRVLVMGAGNSGCDIVVEAAQVAERAFLSMRRGYHYLPKHVLGRPVDQIGDLLLRLRLPLWLRRWIAGLAVRLTAGSPRRVGLPEPDHRLFETHPIVNTLLPYYVRHGRIEPRPDVAALEGDRVRFVDGAEEPVDVIVFATGYALDFPFIDPALLNWRDGRPRLFLNVFHPRLETLFVAGMIQTDSGVFGLVHWQARAIALSLRALRDARPAVDWLRSVRRDVATDLAGGVRYTGSSRHLLEVEHWSYQRRLKKLVRELERRV